MGALFAKLTAGIWGYVIAAAISASLAAYAAYAVTAAFKDNTIKDMKIAEQVAIADAWKTGWARRDAQQEVTKQADLNNAYQQGKLDGNTKEIIRYVPKYITAQDDTRCVLPVGFVRLLDAAGLGITPEQLPNRTTELDSANSGIPLSQATALLAENLGALASFRARLVNARDAWAAQEKATSVKPKPE